MQVIVTVAPDEQLKLKHLSKEEQAFIGGEVVLEMASQKIGFNVSGTPIQSVVIERRIPITSSLTENEFLSGLDDVDLAVVAVQESIALNIERAVNHAR